MPRRPMSPLTDAVYSVLFTMSTKPDPVITEAELVESLPPSQQVDRRCRLLREALAEVGRVCERDNLPRITALVVDGMTRVPANWYFNSAGLDHLSG
jgi:hypothetical protein